MVFLGQLLLVLNIGCLLSLKYLENTFVEENRQWTVLAVNASCKWMFFVRDSKAYYQNVVLKRTMHLTCDIALHNTTAAYMNILNIESCVKHVFYKVRGKMALTQDYTHFLPQLCSALVSNSHPSESDSAWPKTIFSHQVQFHLTGCISPLMHLTVACSPFSPLHLLRRSWSCLNNFFLHLTLLPSLTLSALSFYCLLLQLSVDLCS